MSKSYQNHIQNAALWSRLIQNNCHFSIIQWNIKYNIEPSQLLTFKYSAAITEKKEKATTEQEMSF